MSDEYVIEVDDTQVIAVEAPAAQGPPGLNGASSWNTLADKPTSFPSDWSTTANKPATFPPSAHSHPELAISIAETAWLSTTANDGEAQLGNPNKKYQTVAAAMAAGAKQLVLGPGTFEYVGTDFSAYVRGVSPTQSVLQVAKMGAAGATGAPGQDNEDGDGGNGGMGEPGESLTLNVNIVSDKSVAIQLAFAGGLGGEGGPGGMGSTLVQGNQGAQGTQGVVSGAIALSGCVVNLMTVDNFGSLGVTVKNSQVETTQPEIITSSANSVVNGANPETTAIVTNANAAYLRTATGGTVTGPIVATGANAKVSLPILTTANRAAQPSKLNGDTFIDAATGCMVVRKSGVDTMAMGAEAKSEYPAILDLLRTVRELDPFAHSLQYTHLGLNGGTQSGSSNFGRSFATNNTAGACSRQMWNLGVGNAGLSVHAVQGVDARAIPFNRRVIFHWRFTNLIWREQNSSTNVITSFGQGVFARVYYGCTTGSNYLLNVRGIGIHITDQGQIRLVAHNGTTLTESADLGSYFLNVAGSFSESFTIDSSGTGLVSLYRNGVLLGSITGGPTSVNTINQSGVSWEIGNGTSTTNLSWALGPHKIGVF